ncbi:unnamed protein product, partial [Choristocarpus tenellus]
MPQWKRKKKEERKKAKQCAKLTGAWDRCMFIVQHKGRYCSQQSIQCLCLARSSDSSEFCATHIDGSNSMGKGKRVPCPVDPMHTVFEGQVKAHVKV